MTPETAREGPQVRRRYRVRRRRSTATPLAGFLERRRWKWWHVLFTVGMMLLGILIAMLVAPLAANVVSMPNGNGTGT